VIRSARGIVLAALCPALALALDLPHENAVPGGVKIIRLDDAGAAMPYVEADGHRALVLQDASN
jgi:hypothetical protein